MSEIRLSYVNLVSDDIDALARFYADVFGLEELTDYRSEMYVALDLGGVMFGFSPPAVYELLQMENWRDAAGTRQFMTFEVTSPDAVAEVATMAVDEGGELVREPFETSYGSVQAVLADPDGNVFRVNHQRS